MCVWNHHHEVNLCQSLFFCKRHHLGNSLQTAPLPCRRCRTLPRKREIKSWWCPPKWRPALGSSHRAWVGGSSFCVDATGNGLDVLSLVFPSCAFARCYLSFPIHFLQLSVKHSISAFLDFSVSYSDIIHKFLLWLHDRWNIQRRRPSSKVSTKKRGSTIWSHLVWRHIEG